MLVVGRYIIFEFLLRTFLQLLGYWFGIGIPEDLPDKLRSILAQAEYAYRIREWDAKGVPFRLHAYVPECDPRGRIMLNCSRLLIITSSTDGLFPHRELQYVPEKDNILPIVWRGTRRPWLTEGLGSPFRHWVESGNNQSRMQKGSSMAASRSVSNWMATMRKRSMSQMLGTDIVQLIREGYLSSKEANSTV